MVLEAHVSTEGAELKLSSTQAFLVHPDKKDDMLATARAFMRSRLVEQQRRLGKGSRPVLQRQPHVFTGPQFRTVKWKDYRAKFRRKTTGQWPAAWGGARRMREFGFGGNIVGTPRTSPGPAKIIIKAGLKHYIVGPGRRIRKTSPLGKTIVGKYGLNKDRPKTGRGSRTMLMKPVPGLEVATGSFDILRPFIGITAGEARSINALWRFFIGKRINIINVKGTL